MGAVGGKGKIFRSPLGIEAVCGCYRLKKCGLPRTVFTHYDSHTLSEIKAVLHHSRHGRNISDIILHTSCRVYGNTADIKTVIKRKNIIFHKSAAFQ